MRISKSLHLIFFHYILTLHALSRSVKCNAYLKGQFNVCEINSFGWSHFSKYVIKWTLKIVDFYIVDSFVLVDKLQSPISCL